jgi:hypothetical protein
MKLIQSFDTWNRLYETLKADKGMQPINEASVGETLMSMITSAKNAAAIRSKYKKLKQAEFASKLSAEQEQIDMGLQKDEAWDSAEAAAKEKLNDAIKAKLDAVQDAAKKKIMGPELRKKRDEQLEKLKANFDERYKTKKEIAKKKADKETEEIADAIKELTSLSIENDFLKKKTEEFTSSVDFEEELKYLDASTEQELAASEDPDQQAKAEQRLAAATKRLKEEKTKELAAAKQATEEALAAQEEKLASADERTKESVERLKGLFDAMSKYQEAADKYIASPDDEDAQTAVANAKKALSDAEERIGKKVVIDTGLGTDDDWEDAQAKLTASVDDLRSQYKEDLAGLVKKKEPKKEEPAKTEEPKKEEPKSRELTDKEKERLTKAEAGLTKAREAGDTDKVKRYEDLIKGIKDTKKLGESLDLFKIDEALKSIETIGYISESIATRFKRAMDQRGPRL